MAVGVDCGLRRRGYTARRGHELKCDTFHLLRGVLGKPAAAAAPHRGAVVATTRTKLELSFPGWW
jgi:hypothetical protein